jgi:phosphoglycerate dehydrogenase-like enzyme
LKAVLHHAVSTGLRRRLADACPSWLQATAVDVDDRAGFAEAMREANVLLHVLEPVTAEIIEEAPALRLIQKIGVGVNTIDLEGARARRVAVANMPGTNSQAVAEMTLLLMLGALRRVAALDRAVRAGEGWRLAPEFYDGVGEVRGRAVGLVGYGEIPRRLAPVLAALGARVLYTARSPRQGALAQWRELPALLAESDVVSLHVPETDETRGLLDAAALASMKPGAVLVNTARGGLVDPAALEDALRSGRLGAAGLDVFAAEPVAPDSALLHLDNVVVAPHVAWLTPETFERSLVVAVENCRRLREGEALLHQVI